MSLTLNSPTFANGQPIPKAYAQEGQNTSPPLAWSGAPDGTKSFVLIVEDHDAPVGTVTHWVVYDLAADANGLLEGLDKDQVQHGINDMGHDHYDGPKPPKGDGPHRYHFRLTALDTASLGLSESPESNDVKKAARGHVLEEVELIGTYETK
jgi:Raf kinase inhibitor-like YbhB/YbcL family protein